MTEILTNSLLDWLSGAQIWHLDDKIYVIRRLIPINFACKSIRTYYILDFMCTHGMLQCDIDGHLFTLCANQALVTLPDQTLTIHSITDDFECALNAETREFAESQNVGGELIIYDNLQNNPVLQFDNDTMKINMYFIDMCIMVIAQQDNPNRENVLRLYYTANHLINAGALHARPRFNDAKGENHNDMFMMRFNKLLENNYIRHHDVGFYADEMAITPKYLSTMVDKLSGHSAAWWIDYYLMRDAERYLQKTTLTIQNIADALGFESQSAFGKYFKRQRKMSPKAFRTQISNVKSMT